MKMEKLELQTVLALGISDAVHSSLGNNEPCFPSSNLIFLESCQVPGIELVLGIKADTHMQFLTFGHSGY